MWGGALVAFRCLSRDPSGCLADVLADHVQSGKRYTVFDGVCAGKPQIRNAFSFEDTKTMNSTV